ncbi:OmpA family protein [Pontibacter sp. H249]|uniref:OmpA family protein n=1 Tax=Pontibacter sp. H249 TaxID=3133420 RepID=UPI0030BE32CF
MNYRFTPLYFVLAAMMGLGTTAQAQTELRKANKQYENYEFALALENYQVAVQKKEPDLATTQRIADAYRLTRQSLKAEEWYAKVVNKGGHEPINLFHYAEALRSNGKYEEAKTYYMMWSEEAPGNDNKAQQLIAACDMAMISVSKPATAVVAPVESINMRGFSDFSPVQYGNQIIFTSDRGLTGDKKGGVYGWTGRPYLQLFTAQQDATGNWEAPKALEEVINSEYHNATASASEDGKTLYFTRTHMVPKSNRVNTDPTSWAKEPEVKEFVNRLEIFTAEKQGNAWGNIKPFAYNNIESYSVGHPAISPDGQILYFASDMEGALGDTDIFYSVKQTDGNWGKPVNAGPTVNTAARESFPYVDGEGRLYFASNGHAGLGGLDVFKAEGAHAAWTKVKNLGAPINSSKNDYGIMFTNAGKEGLLSSNRDSQNGTEDIYSFVMLQRPVVIELITLERKQNNEKRNIEVPLPSTKIVVAQKNLNQSAVVITDKRGQHFMDGRIGDVYSLLGTKDGYLTQEKQAEIPATAGDTVQIAMLFDKNELEKAVVLENIYYDLDMWEIRADATKELDKLVAMLKNNPEVKIEMSSHTDSRESVKYNLTLSERRAQAAVDYLVSQGIDRSRLRAKGYGKSRLVNGCADGVVCSEADHQLNRRTEFKIIK